VYLLSEDEAWRPPHSEPDRKLVLVSHWEAKVKLLQKSLREGLPPLWLPTP